MKKKIITLFLISLLALSGCGSSECLDTLKNVEANVNDSAVVLVIPAEYVGDATQSDLDAFAKEKNYDGIILNEDGSATYYMSKEQHESMMADMKQQFTTSIEAFANTKDYPNFTKIEAAEDFATFTVTTISKNVSTDEALLSMALTIYGEMYNVFNGTPVDNIHVDYVHEESGQILHTTDSKEKGEI